LPHSDVVRRTGLRHKEWAQRHLMRQGYIAAQKEPVPRVEAGPAIVCADVIRHGGEVSRSGCIRLREVQHVVTEKREPTSAERNIGDELVLPEHSFGLVLIVRGYAKIRRIIAHILAHELVHSMSIQIVDRHRSSAKELLIDANRKLHRVRRTKIGPSRIGRRVASGGRAARCYRRHRALRIHRVCVLDNQLLLLRTILPHRVQHIANLVAVVEYAKTTAQDRLRRSLRAPQAIGEGDTRCEVMVVSEIVLRLVTEAVAQRKIWLHLPVILGV